MSFEEAVCEAKNLIDGDKVSQVVTINPEMFEYANKDSEFLNIIKEAEMVIPDGIGVKIALRINGFNVNRIPGVDFAKRLLEAGKRENIAQGELAELATIAQTRLSKLHKLGYKKIR